MTEIRKTESQLPEAVQEFVLRWGDMGGEWGVNRSVAQIHALLYLSEKPLTAEEISAKLGIARSNVSTSLRELLTWNLVRRVPVFGDRRDHFEAETDLWQMATRIAYGRKQREVDPALKGIRSALAASEGDPRISKTVRQRLDAMDEFVGTMDRWYQQMLNVPPKQLMALIKLGSRVVGLLRLVGGKEGGRKDNAA